MNLSLRIDYGPYDAFGVITHRIQKIYGLLKHLKQLGYDIDVREVEYLNRLEIVMCDRKIFQCDLRNLKFNMDYEDDEVCQKAIYAVEEAAQRMGYEFNMSSYMLAKQEVEIHHLDDDTADEDYIEDEMISIESINVDIEEEKVSEEGEEEEEEEISSKFKDMIAKETDRELEQIRTKKIEKTMKKGLEDVQKLLNFADPN